MTDWLTRAEVETLTGKRQKWLDVRTQEYRIRREYRTIDGNRHVVFHGGDVRAEMRGERTRRKRRAGVGDWVRVRRDGFVRDAAEQPMHGEVVATYPRYALVRFHGHDERRQYDEGFSYVDMFIEQVAKEGAA